MKITATKLKNNLQNLPDPSNYPYSNYRLVFSQPPNLIANKSMFPNKRHYIEVEFRKERLNNEELDWVIDWPTP